MIKILDNETIQKIAAGEVVERPASIIKELVENSIDANSTNIIVEIKNGGKSYIKVSDNGIGIESTDVELAFERHATSKINNFDDLYKIYSMGFRGEALASIVSVSKIIMRTKSVKEDIGTMIEYDNNKLIGNHKIATNIGTSIEVLDLFKFIPARLKFLSSDISEGNKITNLMYVFAIGNPQISFTYIRDNKEIFTTNNEDTEEENLNILFGKDFIKDSIKINNSSDNYKIKGIISNNKYYKGNRSMQYIFVNGRYIENEKIVETIENAYHLQIPNGRFPAYKLNIEVNPDLIDINIHPNKQKIKFSYTDELMELIYNTFVENINKNDISKNVKNKEIDTKYISFHELNTEDGYQRILDSYKEPINIEYENLLNNFEVKDNEEIIKFYDLDIDEDFDSNINEVTNFKNENEKINTQIEMDISNIKFNTILFNKYIVFDNEIDKIILIDINRANRRILFDKEIKNSAIISQNLIEPIILNLTSKELELFIQNHNIINKYGYDTDVFGENKILIRAIPYYLSEPNTIDDFKIFLDEISSIKDKDNSHILRKIVALSIHKKNISTEDEANLFYKELKNTSNMYTDPLGKTIIYNLDLSEFKKFLEG